MVSTTEGVSEDPVGIGFALQLRELGSSLSVF